MVSQSHRPKSGGKGSGRLLLALVTCVLIPGVLASGILIASRAEEQDTTALHQPKAAPGHFAFPAPPRTIADITAILDQQKPDPAAVAANKAKADAEPPVGLSGSELAHFYSERGSAAGDLGRETQRLG